MKIRNEGFYYKISDTGYNQRFIPQKPFDCFNLKNIDAFVVVCWYVPRKKKTLYYIRVELFKHKKENSKMKSFTELEAAAMATHILEL